jgi:hypothetical protein
MDYTSTDPQTTDQWALSRLGFAIDTLVDRTINSPQAIDNPAIAYGVDANGNMYQVGQPGTIGVNGARRTTTMPITVPPLLILAVLAIVLIHHH